MTLTDEIMEDLHQYARRMAYWHLGEFPGSLKYLTEMDALNERVYSHLQSLESEMEELRKPPNRYEVWSGEHEPALVGVWATREEAEAHVIRHQLHSQADHDLKDGVWSTNIYDPSSVYERSLGATFDSVLPGRYEACDMNEDIRGNSRIRRTVCGRHFITSWRAGGDPNAAPEQDSHWLTAFGSTREEALNRLLVVIKPIDPIEQSSTPPRVEP